MMCWSGGAKHADACMATVRKEEGNRHWTSRERGLDMGIPCAGEVSGVGLGLGLVQGPILGLKEKSPITIIMIKRNNIRQNLQKHYLKERHDI